MLRRVDWGPYQAALKGSAKAPNCSRARADRERPIAPVQWEKLDGSATDSGYEGPRKGVIVADWRFSCITAG